MNLYPDSVEQLREAIAQLRPGEDGPPAAVGGFWDDILRMTLDGWARALARDIRRAGTALDQAAEAAGKAPNDEQVAAAEECLWRLASATDKVDAIISLTFGGDPFVVVADKPTEMTMRPSRNRNKAALKKIGSDAAERLMETRAALAGERSRLRRHQLMHSLAPIDALADIGVFIRVHHRDGRIFGYELLRWSPERWDEGVDALTPEDLFAQRVKESRRGLEALLRVIEAVACDDRRRPGCSRAATRLLRPRHRHSRTRAALPNRTAEIVPGRLRRRRHRAGGVSSCELHEPDVPRHRNRVRRRPLARDPHPGWARRRGSDGDLPGDRGRRLTVRGPGPPGGGTAERTLRACAALNRACLHAYP